MTYAKAFSVLVGISSDFSSRGMVMATGCSGSVAYFIDLSPIHV